MAQNDMKFLTIAIPTYNRSHYLKECLDHICPQLNSYVELVVRDNCSDNYNFGEFIKPYKEKYGIVAYQNKVNIGSDGNAARLFECCETKWLWILGDDDYVAPNAINLVLSIIQKNEDCVFIKFNSPVEGRFSGLKGFAEAMKPRGAFGRAFFISEGIHNVERTMTLMYWHYKFMSTSISQILRVMWHLAKNENDSCLFVNDKLLEEHGLDTTWGHIDLVPYQALIFDIFRPYRKILKNNVYRDIVRYCYAYISESTLSFREKIHLYAMFINKQGLFNVIIYNYLDIAYILVKAALGIKRTEWVKRYIVRLLNN